MEWDDFIDLPDNFRTEIAIALCFLSLMLLNIAAGWRQWRQGGGSIPRLLWVSVLFCFLETVPILTFVFIAMGFAAQDRSMLGPSIVVWPVALINFFYLVLCLWPLVQVPEFINPVPLIDDVDVLARVEELSRKLGISAPKTRLYHSLDANLDRQGWAFGVVAPSIVISDGILQRLTPRECDSVIAHELAHLANKSLWILISITPITSMFVICISQFVPAEIALLAGFAIWTGLYRIVSRFLEIDCDHKAGQAAGFREMAVAQTKLQPGWTPEIGDLGTSLYSATSTHPHRDIRLACLLRQIPIGSDDDELAYSPATVRQQHFLSTILTCVWLGIIFVSLIVTWRAKNSFGMCLPLFAAGIAPRAFQRWSFWRAQSIQNQRFRSWPTWDSRVLQFGCAATIVVSGFVAKSYEWSLFGISPIHLMYAALFIMLIPIGRAQSVTALLNQVRLAIQIRDYPRVIELSQSAPKLVARSPHLRHNLAMATEITGNRALAISMFESLRKDVPRFKYSWFYLVSLYLEDNNPARALEVAQETAGQLPKDPGSHQIVARAARRLGDLDLAEAAIERRRALWPESADMLATIAGIALDRGDRNRAVEMIERATKLDPDEPYVLLIKAQIWLQTAPFESAREIAEKVIAIVDAEPRHGLGYEVSLLKKAISADPE